LLKSLDETSPLDLEQVRQAALEKYGPPTIVGTWGPEWCAKIEPDAIFKGKDACPHEGKAALVLWERFAFPPKLDLFDNSYVEKLRAAVQQMSGKPKL
jgi:hypothetical protein